jgi:hypothetical protein
MCCIGRKQQMIGMISQAAPSIRTLDVPKTGASNEAIYRRSSGRADDGNYRAGGTNYQALIERLVGRFV